MTMNRKVNNDNGLQDWKTEHQAVTRNIAKKGFSGMRSSSPASSSLYLDNDVLRIPFQAILLTFVAKYKKECYCQFE